MARNRCRVLLTRREKRRTPWLPLRKVLREILLEHSVTGTLSIVLVEDDEIQDLHGEFLGEDRPTDVLSFPLQETDDESLESTFGEVIVSTDTAVREAAKRKIPVSREVALYAIHGTLHLVGFDDHSAVDRRAMRRAERRYLRRFQEVGGE